MNKRDQTMFEAARAKWAEEAIVTKAETINLDAARDRLLELDLSVGKFTKATSEAAREMGEWLIKVKAQVGHGNFMKWVKANLKWSHGKVNDLMHHVEECISQGHDVPYHPGIRNRSQSAEKDERYTDPLIIAAARKVMRTIDLDPSSCRKAQERVRATRYFSLTPEEGDPAWSGVDGLKQSWRRPDGQPSRIWLNPPFSSPLTEDFVKKLLSESRAGNIRESMTLLSYDHFNAPWFDAGDWSQICHLGFPKFTDSKGRKATGGRPGNIIVYLGPNFEEFTTAFSHFGAVYDEPLVPMSTLERNEILADEWERDHQ